MHAIELGSEVTQSLFSHLELEVYSRNKQKYTAGTNKREFCREMSSVAADMYLTMAVVEATNRLVGSPKGMTTTNQKQSVKP